MEILNSSLGYNLKDVPSVVKELIILKNLSKMLKKFMEIFTIIQKQFILLPKVLLQ